MERAIVYIMKHVMIKTHRLYVSHSWAYNDAESTMFRFLDKLGLDYKNCSLPSDDPVHIYGSDEELKYAIDEKIRDATCLVILAGVYESYDRWIAMEIELANQYGKPILAVQPWTPEQTSGMILHNARKIVKWQGNSIVEAIIEVDRD